MSYQSSTHPFRHFEPIGNNQTIGFYNLQGAGSPHTHCSCPSNQNWLNNCNSYSLAGQSASPILFVPSSLGFGNSFLQQQKQQQQQQQAIPFSSRNYPSPTIVNSQASNQYLTATPKLGRPAYLNRAHYEENGPTSSFSQGFHSNGVPRPSPHFAPNSSKYVLQQPSSNNLRNRMRTNNAPGLQQSLRIPSAPTRMLDRRMADLISRAPGFNLPESIQSTEKDNRNPFSSQDGFQILMPERPAYAEKVNCEHYGCNNLYKHSLLSGETSQHPPKELNRFFPLNKNSPPLSGLRSQDSTQSDNLNEQPSLMKENGFAMGKSFVQGQKDGNGTANNDSDSMFKDQFRMIERKPSVEADVAKSNSTFQAERLDFNAPVNSHPFFARQLSVGRDEPQNSDAHGPPKHFVSQIIKNKLALKKFCDYEDDLLFFILYMYGGKESKMAAAYELYMRNWKYHKDGKVWITRTAEMVPFEKTSSYERGLNYYFDLAQWKKVVKEFHIEYERLEDCPPNPQEGVLSNSNSQQLSGSFEDAQNSLRCDKICDA